MPIVIVWGITDYIVALNGMIVEVEHDWHDLEMGGLRYGVFVLVLILDHAISKVSIVEVMSSRGLVFNLVSFQTVLWSTIQVLIVDGIKEIIHGVEIVMLLVRIFLIADIIVNFVIGIGNSNFEVRI